MIDPAPQFTGIWKNTTLPNKEDHIRCEVTWYRIENDNFILPGPTAYPESLKGLRYSDLCVLIANLEEVKKQCEKIMELPDGCYGSPRYGRKEIPQ